MAFREPCGKSRVGNNLPGTHGATPYIIRTRNKVIERRRKRNEVQRVLQRRPAPGVVVLPFNACWALFIAFRECRGKSRVGNSFRRRGRQPKHSGDVRFSILFMKERSNFKTTPMGFDCAMTVSEPQRVAVTGHVRLTAGATQGEGARLGRDPSKTGRNSPERSETFPVQLRHVPRCVHMDAKLNF